MTVQDHTATSSTSSTSDPGDFERDWHAWRQEHQERLAAPHGFLAITHLHWLSEAPERFEGVPGEWTSGPDGVSVRLDPEEVLELDGERLHGRHDFGPIPERGGVLAAYGEVVLEVARRGGHDLLRPRHPDHPLRTAFRGTPAYAPDPAWSLRGRYVAFDAPRPTTVGAAVDGLEHVYDAPGEVVFELGGEEHRLTAFEGGATGGLFLLLTDATSGVTTYAACRALDVAPPGPDGEVRLDLNRTRNLPCAYTDLATCPLPPAGNHLPVAVEAGEQTPYERRGEVRS